jgi:putative ABC transport system substrate-binding protein
MRSRTAARVLVVLILLLALAILLAPAEAQPVGKVWRIGFLHTLSLAPMSEEVESFRQGLRELGYVEGQNILIEYRWAYGVNERLPELAADLVRLKVDVIVAPSNPGILAAQKVTRTIPIVMVIATDPVGLGFVASLARPGGNITGMSGLAAGELVAKRQQLLSEALPRLSRVAILWEPEPGRQHQMKEAELAAHAAGLEVQLVEARSPSELDSAFAAMTRKGVGAAHILGSSMLWTHRARIAEHAVKSRLPTMCAEVRYVEAGCLMSYGAGFSARYRRAAYFIDKLLKGTNPGDLPVEQPTKFELVINLKTAKALGLTIPPSLLLRADQVIE